MSYSQNLASARNTTKQVKSVLAGLLVTVKTNAAMGAVMVSGHSDELLRAEHKLQASGFVVRANYGDMLWAGQA